jgi:hypothetical protein
MNATPVCAKKLFDRYGSQTQYIRLGDLVRCGRIKTKRKQEREESNYIRISRAQENFFFVFAKTSMSVDARFDSNDDDD